MRSAPLLLFVTVVGCGGTTAPSSEIAQALGLSLVGNWINGAAEFGAGDIVSLQLAADTRFARVRCLTDPCDAAVAEDGHWDLRGHTVRFYLEGGSVPGPIALHGSKLLDRFTATLDGSVLTLARRDGSSFALGAVADAELCRMSGGRFADSCDCGRGWFFSPGQGGCVVAPTPSEALCDSSGGSWTDDDINLLGTYCECPRDQIWRLDGTGCGSP
jgi:hypothetical protein